MGRSSLWVNEDPLFLLRNTVVKLSSTLCVVSFTFYDDL